jgi:hypothetical protein
MKKQQHEIYERKESEKHLLFAVLISFGILLAGFLALCGIYTIVYFILNAVS